MNFEPLEHSKQSNDKCKMQKSNVVGSLYDAKEFGYSIEWLKYECIAEPKICCDEDGFLVLLLRLAAAVSIVIVIGVVRTSSMHFQASNN